MIISTIGRQYPQYFLWWPVFFGLGIGVYFALPFEPPIAIMWFAAMGAVVGLIICATSSSVMLRFGMVLMLALAGFGMAQYKAHSVAAPKIFRNYYGPVVGCIIAIDTSPSGKRRLTLDAVFLPKIARKDTPARVRISLHDHALYMSDELRPGKCVMTTAYLNPPSGPVEPNGFNFARHAWFLRLGAVGYTRVGVSEWKAPDDRIRYQIGHFRMALSQHIQTKIPGKEGPFASALLTGDRSNIDQNIFNALRESNLAHILAISGLHMGLISTFVFALFRIATILLSGFSQKSGGVRLAAMAAIASALVYLCISGASVATQRACVMVVIAFIAIAMKRRAISLHSVALAALIVLIVQPQSLINPGFQMSFAATFALVVIFRSAFIRENILARAARFSRPLLSLVIASLSAGMITAPIAAAHFNQIAHYGLAANLAALPVLGILVMPGGVIAALLAPFGLEIIGLTLMQIGISWILAVAQEISSWPNAVSKTMMPPYYVLPLLYGGIVFSVLWIGALKWAGIAASTLALSIWAQAERPPILLSENARLIGTLGPQGRVLNKAKGDGFSAAAWLENDGDSATQADAHKRAGMRVQGAVSKIRLGPHTIIHAYGKRGAIAALQSCADASLILLAEKMQENMQPFPPDCSIIKAQKLEQMGALSIGLDAQNNLKIRNANGMGQYEGRIWDNALKRAYKKRPRRLAKRGAATQ